MGHRLREGEFREECRTPIHRRGHCGDLLPDLEKSIAPGGGHGASAGCAADFGGWPMIRRD
ncbi:MAG: hypothetical protein CMJ54_04295 [Planctomycetaceae bacterium]|nr:hypothetical protein [Planctomycetaceae bacterium]